MIHTLPDPSDRAQVKPNPTGLPWHLTDLTEEIPLDNRLTWNSHGVVYYPQLIHDSLIEEYKAEWLAANGPLHHHPDGTVDAPRLGGYNEVGYLNAAVLMRVCTHPVIAEVWEDLLGEPAGVHLNLTGWVSTERNWHSDYYLNEKCVGDYYGALWVALDDVHPDSGPFEYFPGSHLWPGVVTKARIGQAVDLTDPRWPAHTEDVLEPLVEAEAAARGVEKIVHLPRRGDVLFWHGRLYHRGSRAVVPQMYRGALIAHYSGLNHRTDMPPAVRYQGNGFYFPLRPLGPGL